MGGTTSCAVRVDDARELARELLHDLPERWRHTAGVAHRAEEFVGTLDGEDPEVLIAACWLHDIGYAEPLRDTGFHPLDGARYLDRWHWPWRLCGLVAHHSGACFTAQVRGLEHELAAYPDEESTLSDALTYADQTVGPGGQRFTLPERMADMLRRHGPDSPNARVHHRRGPHLRAIADRVEQRLAE